MRKIYEAFGEDKKDYIEMLNDSQGFDRVRFAKTMIGINDLAMIGNVDKSLLGKKLNIRWSLNGLQKEEKDNDKIVIIEPLEEQIILGGEPMHPNNIEATTWLAKSFKEKYPDKSLWVWSGFLFDKDLKDKEVLKYVDVLVDGQYKDDLHDFTLQWRGSSNQRVIDVKKSIEQNEVITIV